MTRGDARMANVLPPSKPAGAPVLKTLAAGEILFRIHRKAYAASGFNPRPAHQYYGGGRFDATVDDVYPYIYVGESAGGAISETFLRDLPVDTAGPRILAKSGVRGRRISAVRVEADLPVLQLVTGIELGQLSQDPWLTTCDPRDYAQTRHWGHIIRGWAPDAAGFVWRSRREPEQRSYVLFGDRCRGDALTECAHPSLPTGAALDFDTPQGIRWLRGQLAAYGVTVTRR
jgi:hypothetical protein